MSKLVKPSDLTKKQDERLSELNAGQREIALELMRLTELKGYAYARNMAYEFIVKPLECNPPSSSDDTVKWNTYNQVRWAIERLFSLIEMTAKNCPPPYEELKARYGTR